jgi:hypothetical protein
MNDYLSATALLDFDAPEIRRLVAARGWAAMAEREKIRSIYDFVRDEIRFGFNERDELPASRILEDGYGQCNTKSILFMALLRAAAVPCRLHGFTVRSDLQRGALTGLWYRLRPKELVHTWVELKFEGIWRNLEGFILDRGYLRSVQENVKDCRGSFCGYGIAISDALNPPVEWEGGDTYIQKDGILRDFGAYDSPDAFFRDHSQAMGLLKASLFRTIVRRSMNRNIVKMRERARRATA